MGNSLWKNLGFRENPYDTKPLKVNKADVDLLMGRENEQIDFLTAIESDDQGVLVISGVPGVGKTSFLNVQQYLLESGEAEFGPKILSARTLCPIQAFDEPKQIALRCIQSYCKSIQEYCIINSIQLPSQTSKIQQWLFQNKPATINLGITIFGHGVNFGRDIHLPTLSETTFETFIELLHTISIEVTNELGFKGSFIVLDNIENLDEEDLSVCLTTFRDTLFTIPNIWWILIGQSGLSSLIQSSIPKVFQRLSASIELKPISVENLIKAVDKRVIRFHDTENDGSSPITEKIYLKLFESSNGEIRFVFKYCNSICVKFVTEIRKIISEELINNFESIMGRHLVNRQINDTFSNSLLEQIIKEEFNGFHLEQDQKQVLNKIGILKKVKPNDYHEFKTFGIYTMQDFSINYLSRLSSLNLLLRRQEGKILTYELRGISVFALEYNLLD